MGPTEIEKRRFGYGQTYQFSHRASGGREFEISVALPSAPAPSGCPVMWLLDPHHSFGTLVETVRNQERMFGPVIVVGIGYPNQPTNEMRIADLTPTSAGRAGSGALLKMIIDELRPIISSEGIDPERQAIFGHSLSGLFVLNALFTEPTAFDTYVAGSPSIWWNGAAIIERVSQAPDALAAVTRPRRLLISVGELESTVNQEEVAIALADGITDLKHRKKKNQMVERAVALAEQLSSFSPNLLTSLAIFVGETHNSCIPATIGRGARFALQGWYGANPADS